MSVAGIDVSHYQGDIDWQAVRRSGRRFVMPAMSGWGLHNTDPSWTTERHREIVAQQLVCFPYFYGLPDEDPKESAHRAVELALSRGWHPRRGGFRHLCDGPIMLDLEVARGESGEHIQWWGDTFCRSVHAQVGRGCIDYSYGGFKREEGLRPFQYGGVYAHAEYQTNRPHVPPGFLAHFWQWTQTGYCPGVPAPVDLDVFFGTERSLLDFARG